MQSSPTNNITHKRISSHFLPFMDHNWSHEKSSIKHSVALCFFIVCIVKDGKLLRTSHLFIFHCIEYFYLYSTVIFPLELIAVYFNLFESGRFFWFRFHNWDCLSVFHGFNNKIDLLSKCKIYELNHNLIVGISPIVLWTGHF